MVSGSGEDPWGALEGGNPLDYAPDGEDGRDAVAAFLRKQLPMLTVDEHRAYCSALWATR